MGMFKLVKALLSLWNKDCNYMIVTQL